MTADPVPGASEPPPASEDSAERIRPMLPEVVEAPFDSPGHIFEVKWGGIRAVARLDRGMVRLHGRSLRDLTSLYPELAALEPCLRAEQAIVDGEILAWGTENLPAFELLRPRLLRPDAAVEARRRSPVIYQVFDLLEIDGTSLLDRPLFERRTLLHERLQPNRVVQAADFVMEDGVAFFEAVARHGLEGMVAKDKQSPYLPGRRSDAWKEVRAVNSAEFVVGGYSFGGGRRRDPIGSLLLGLFHDGTLEFVGQVSIGCTDRESRQLLQLLEPLHVDSSPFEQVPSVPRFIYWCRPTLACRIRYACWGDGGLLRFPVFVAPRPDIDAADCVRAPGGR